MTWRQISLRESKHFKVLIILTFNCFIIGEVLTCDWLLYKVTDRLLGKLEITTNNLPDNCVGSDLHMKLYKHFRTFHSIETRHIDDNAVLSQGIIFEFSNVYTGKWIAKLNSCVCELNGIETDYVMERVSYHFGTNCKEKKHHLKLSFDPKKFLNVFPNSGLNVTISDRNCLLERVDVEQPAEFICEDQASCLINGGKIDCYVENLDEGNYSLALYVLNSTKCHEQGLWHSSCTTNANFGHNCKDVHEVRVTTSFQFSALWPVWLVIIVLFVLVVFLKTGSKPRRSTISTKSDASDEETDGEILLVYARDCSEFDDVINCLKRTLRGILNYKVYDIYEDSFMRECSNNFQLWLADNVQRNNNFKIILFETNCASFLLDKDARTILQPYRSPTDRDKVFNAAVSYIERCYLPKEYRRLFIVTFGSAMAESCFRTLVPSTRYELETHTKQLMKALRCEMDQKLEAIGDEKAFHSIAMASRIFKRKDPSYLRELLNAAMNKD